MNFKVIFLLLFSIFILNSCKNEKIETSAITFDGNDLQIHYAKFFKISIVDSIYVLQIMDPWVENSILAKYSFSYSDKYLNSKEIIHLPISSLSVHSLNYVGYLNELNELDRISSITDGNRIYNAKIRQNLQMKSVVDLGPSVDFNIERLIISNPKLILSTAYQSSIQPNPILEKLSIPTLYNLDWMEFTPLGRAEWIKVIGLITGKLDKADSLFNQIEKNYLETVELTKRIESRSTVFFASGYNDIWYMPGGKSFKAKLIKDAGANYFWSNDTNSGSLPLSFEFVLKNHIDNDFWIEVPFWSYREMTNINSKHSNFKAFKTKNVYNNFGRADRLSNDYWETGMCRPDIILKDLVSIFYPQLIDHQLIYYKPLDDEN